MLIPLLAISLIAYTDKSPAIIGAVTAEQEQNNVIGSYSINPSFKAKIDYNLDDYTIIKQTLDKIIDECKNSEHIGQCLRDKSTGLKWNCEEQKPNDEASAILFDFVDKFNECLNLEGSNLVCRFSFDERKLENSPLYNIELSSEGGKINAKLKLMSEILATAYIAQGGIFYADNYDNKKRKQADIASITIKYVGKKPNIYNAYAESSEDKSKINLIDEQKSFESRNLLFLYKNTDEFGYSQVSFIDSQVQNSFRAPPPANNIIDLPKTKGIKFCAKTGKKVYAYDSSDNQVKLRDIVYKFAVTYPDLPPQPLKNVEAFDKPKADKSILVKWENSSENNVAKYRIYFAESRINVFDKTATDDLKKNPKVIFVKDVELEPSVNFEGALAPNECVFDYTSKKCGFSTSNEKNIPIENNKLYFSKSSNSYIYGLVLPSDNTNYDIGITAVGRANNEINNKDESQKIPVVKSIQSVDDLPPDSGKIVSPSSIKYISSKQVMFTFLGIPSINIDGTVLNDFKEYKVYYSKHPASSQQIIELQNSVSDSKLNRLLSGIAYSQEGNNFVIDISSTDTASADLYFFVIVAFDNAGNPKEDKFKVKELGAVPLQLTIP